MQITKTGYNLVHPMVKGAMDERQTQNAVLPVHDPKPVSGWLLFLCLLLTIVTPLAAIYQLSTEIVPKILIPSSPRMTILRAVLALLTASLGTFSFIAGLKLGLVKNDAVPVARRFLLAYVAANLGYFVFWLLVMHPSDRLRLAAMGWRFVVGPIGSFALWFTYL